MADERITVSRETLRAELAEMELRLTKWVASADSVRTLETRVANLEASRLTREHLSTDVAQLEQDVRSLHDDKVGRDTLRRFVAAAVAAAAAIGGAAAALGALFL